MNCFILHSSLCIISLWWCIRWCSILYVPLLQVQLAYKTITGFQLPYELISSRSNSKTLTFEDFCCLVSEFRYTYQVSEILIHFCFFSSSQYWSSIHCEVTLECNRILLLKETDKWFTLIYWQVINRFNNSHCFHCSYCLQSRSLMQKLAGGFCNFPRQISCKIRFVFLTLTLRKF
jgi:hypothetical protein